MVCVPMLRMQAIYRMGGRFWRNRWKRGYAGCWFLGSLQWAVPFRWLSGLVFIHLFLQCRCISGQRGDWQIVQTVVPATFQTLAALSGPPLLKPAFCMYFLLLSPASLHYPDPVIGTRKKHHSTLFRFQITITSFRVMPSHRRTQLYRYYQYAERKLPMEKQDSQERSRIRLLKDKYHIHYLFPPVLSACSTTLRPGFSTR